MRNLNNNNIRKSHEALTGWQQKNLITSYNKMPLKLWNTPNVSDIDAAKNREKQNEEKYRNLVEQAADGIFLIDLKGNFIAVNTSGSNMLGYDNKKMLQLNIIDILPEEYVAKMPIRLTRLMNGEPLLVERQFKRKNGTLFYTEVRAQIVPGEIIQAIVRDITERKIAEQSLIEALERYDILTKATSDTIWDWDIVNNKMTYNDVITKMFGYRSSKIKNLVEWWKQNIHPEDIKRVTASLNEVFSTKVANFQLEYRFKCDNGTYKYIYDRAFVIFDESGKPIRMIGAMQDISERTDAENAFKAMKRELMSQKVEEQKKITRAVLSAQEKERRYMGEELHDNINQMLAGTKLYLSMAGKTNDSLKEALKYPMQLIDETMQEIRMLTRINVTPKQNINLKELVQVLIDTMFKNTLVKTCFTYNLPEDNCDDGLKLNIYRIIQEQTNNIMKHADAANLTIAISGCNNILDVVITDDGNGFNINSKKEGIGINNIINRVQSFNGDIEIITSPKNGCKMLIRIPY